MKQNPGSVDLCTLESLDTRGGESGRDVSREMYHVARQICFIWTDDRCVYGKPFWL